MSLRTRVLLLLGCIAWAQPGFAQDAAPPGVQGLHLRMVAEIGGDFVYEEYLLNHVGPIAVADGGEIYILDVGDAQVKVYSSAGEFLRRIGRPGRGPGEFMRPVAIFVDSLVRVFDLSQRRVAVFRTDGTHLTTDPTPAISEPPPAIIHRLRGGGLLGEIGSMVSASDPLLSRWDLSIVYRAPGATEAQILMSYRSPTAIWRPQGQSSGGAPRQTDFGFGGAMALLGDSILALANGYSGEVTWYRANADGLSRIRTAALPIASRPVTAADLKAAEVRSRDRDQGVVPPREFVEAPPRWSTASSALFAEDGSLWIRSVVDAESGEVWQVFPAGGGAVRVLRMPRNFELRAVGRELIYAVSRTANGADRVRVFAWSWQ